MFDYKRIISNKNMRLMLLNALRIVPDKALLKIEYRIKTGEKLNLKNPQTFTEKLQWLKLYDRKPIYTVMVDKLAAKKYVTDILGEGHVVPLLGVWDSFDEIDFTKLPIQFVLKCTHDSGSIILCKDKSRFDFKEAQKTMNFHLSIDEYALGREWPYKNVPRRIIAEKYLKTSIDSNDLYINDYKFFCFNGKPKVMYISNDKGDDPRTDFFDMDFNHLPIKMRDPNSNILPKKPKVFDAMKEMAARLSAGIPHLRVDFYVVDDNIYVGELTFYHNSGFTKVSPDEWNRKMGEWIVLPKQEI